MIRLLIGLVLYAAVVAWCLSVCRGGADADAFAERCAPSGRGPRRKVWR